MSSSPHWVWRNAGIIRNEGLDMRGDEEKARRSRINHCFIIDLEQASSIQGVRTIRVHGIKIVYVNSRRIYGEIIGGHRLLEIGNLRLIGLNPPTEFSPPR